MTFHRRMFHLIDSLEIDQKKFAADIGVSAQMVSKWRTGALKSYKKYIGEIADFFSVTSDYFLGKGVFQNWDMVMRFPSEVFNELRNQIPSNFFDVSVDEDFYLIAWLDKHMCYGITGAYELDLIRWFHSNVEQVEFGADDDDSVSWVSVSFRSSASFLTQNIKGQKGKPTPLWVSGLSDEALEVAAAYDRAAKKDQDTVRFILADCLPRPLAAREWAGIAPTEEEMSGVTVVGEDHELP